MDSITLNAYAKINLFLEVCEKRPDSYHNIDSIMQSVSLCDVVTVEKCSDIILSNNIGLPNNEKNLAYKAAAAFFKYTSINSGAKIYIEKIIPVSAGLAGGSTDAAAVLKCLDAIYETNLGIDTLCKIGSNLGADVPFCIRGGTYITKGIGDVFTKCHSLPQCFIVISKCGEGVSTPFAYGEIDSSRINTDYTAKSSNDISLALKDGNISVIAKNMFNAFEGVVSSIRPKVNEQKSIMLENDALCSMMSGSGPSVFGLFTDECSANKALVKLKEYGADAHICYPL